MKKYAYALLIFTLTACGSENSSPSSTPSPSPQVKILTTPLGACAQDNALFRTVTGGCEYNGIVFSKLYKESKTQGDASGYCGSLRESGFRDWRLPSSAELKSVAAANNGNLDLLGLSSVSIWSYDLTSVVNFPPYSTSTLSTAFVLCVRDVGAKELAE